MAKGNNQQPQAQDTFYPPQQNDIINQIPEQMPQMPPMMPPPVQNYDYTGAAAMAKEMSDVKGMVAKQENAYDAKKMERMVKGMSIDQQTAMARQFNHYALLEGLKYQFEHLDELESDINNAFAKLADSREER